MDDWRGGGKNLAIFSGRFYNRGCHEDFRIRPRRVRFVRLVLPSPERRYGDGRERPDSGAREEFPSMEVHELV